MLCHSSDEENNIESVLQGVQRTISENVAVSSDNGPVAIVDANREISNKAGYIIDRYDSDEEYNTTVDNSESKLLLPSDITEGWLKDKLNGSGLFLDDPVGYRAFCLWLVDQMRDKTDILLFQDVMDRIGMEHSLLVNEIVTNRLVIYYTLALMLTTDENVRDDIITDIKNSSARDLLDAMLAAVLESELNTDTVDELLSAPKALKRFERFSDDYSNALKLLDSCEITPGKDYETIEIPRSQISKNELLARFPMTPVTAVIPEWAAPVFDGIDNFNIIQSAVAGDAMNSDKNLLICAPTGSGKTNIALLTIVRAVSQFVDSGILKSRNFKIVYISPMKALVAEQVKEFSNRLNKCNLGLKVTEMTGDISLRETALADYQLLVCTPEKFDVMMRRSGERISASVVKLIIFDEIHLLHNSRGPVLERIITRIKMRSQPIRIVGLSATVPNPLDVAEFIGINVSGSPSNALPYQVNEYDGLFTFNSSFRPIPTQNSIIVVKTNSKKKSTLLYNEAAYETVLKYMVKQKQALVFAHSRSDTQRTAKFFYTRLLETGELGCLFGEGRSSSRAGLSDAKVQMAELKQLLEYGIGFHHAGMDRNDRDLVERLFFEGNLRIIVSTSTLAWGVNLPAHAVIIKGTKMYDAEKGDFIPLPALDIIQMLGRAGRPPFDTIGCGTVITDMDDRNRILLCSHRNVPIESQLVDRMLETINAEVAQSNVSNLLELNKYLGMTFLAIRARKSPRTYNVEVGDTDSSESVRIGLESWLSDLGLHSIMELEKLQLIKFDNTSGNISSTVLGRLAATYYLQPHSANHLKSCSAHITSMMSLLGVISRSPEFKDIRVRPESIPYFVSQASLVPIAIESRNVYSCTKVNVVLQAYISRAEQPTAYTKAEVALIVQNTKRICSALVELSIRKREFSPFLMSLQLTAALTRQSWQHGNFVRQLSDLNTIDTQRCDTLNLDYRGLRLLEESVMLTLLNHDFELVRTLTKQLKSVPAVSLTTRVWPRRSTQLVVSMTVTPEFDWNPRTNIKSETIYVVITDVNSREILYISKLSVNSRQPHKITAFINDFSVSDNHLLAHVIYPNWAIPHETFSIPIAHCIPLSTKYTITACPAKAKGELSSDNIGDVWGVLSAMFDGVIAPLLPSQLIAAKMIAANSDNFVVCIPPGHGRLFLSEIAVARVLSATTKPLITVLVPDEGCVNFYLTYWKSRLAAFPSITVNSFNGDVLLDHQAAKKSHFIVTSFKSFEIFTRRSTSRRTISRISLILTMHGEHISDRPALEVALTRIRVNQLSDPESIQRIGFIGQSSVTIDDMAVWLGANKGNTLNFVPSSRIGKLAISIVRSDVYDASTRTNARIASLAIHTHIGKRVAYVTPDLNSAINMHTRLMDNPPSNARIISSFEDVTSLSGSNIQHIVIPIHFVEYVFESFELVILLDIETPTLASMSRVVSLCDIKESRMEIFCTGSDEEYIKDLISAAYPYESVLPDALIDVWMSEIANGIINNKQDALDWLSWSFYNCRLFSNPNAYGAVTNSLEMLNEHSSELVEDGISELARVGACTVADDEFTVGDKDGLLAIGSYYGLRFYSLGLLIEFAKSDQGMFNLLDFVASNSYENVDLSYPEGWLSNLATICQFDESMVHGSCSSNPRLAILLAYLCRFKYPCCISDVYVTNFLSCADALLSALLDVAAIFNNYQLVKITIKAMQCLVQGVCPLFAYGSLLQLPHINTVENAKQFVAIGIESPLDFSEADDELLVDVFTKLKLSADDISEIAGVANELPNLELSLLDEPDMGIKIFSADEWAPVVHSGFWKFERTNVWILLASGEGGLFYCRRINIKALPLNVSNIPASGSVRTIELMSCNYIGLDRVITV